MSERREFVKVERMGDKARYSVEIPITAETIHDRMDELEQRISDVNDAALYDRSQLEERIDALERRIDFMAAEGSKYVHEYRLNIIALAERIEKLERKLNHKGVEQ